jgi:hypothetical protein
MTAFRWCEGATLTTPLTRRIQRVQRNIYAIVPSGLKSVGEPNAQSRALVFIQHSGRKAVIAPIRARGSHAEVIVGRILARSALMMHPSWRERIANVQTEVARARRTRVTRPSKCQSILLSSLPGLTRVTPSERPTSQS